MSHAGPYGHGENESKVGSMGSQSQNADASAEADPVTVGSQSEFAVDTNKSLLLPTAPMQVPSQASFSSPSLFIPPNPIGGVSMASMSPSQFMMAARENHVHVPPQLANALASLQSNAAIPLMQPTVMSMPMSVISQGSSPAPHFGNFPGYLPSATRGNTNISVPVTSQRASLSNPPDLMTMVHPLTQMACTVDEALQDPKFAPAGMALLDTMQAASKQLQNLMHPTAVPVPSTVFSSSDKPAVRNKQNLSTIIPLPETTTSGTDVSLPQPSQDTRQTLFLGSNVERRGDALPSARRPSTVEDYQLGELMDVASDIPSYDDGFYLRAFSSIVEDENDLGGFDLVVGATRASAPIERPPTPRPPSPPKSTSKGVPVRAACGIVKAKPSRSRPPSHINVEFRFEGSPQNYLMAILRERGYPRDRISSAAAGYFKQVSPLQLASFGSELVRACNLGNVALLSAMLDCGLSPNPSNNFGDDIVHLVCKRANTEIFQCLVDHGCDLQVADSFGRTPLHHVAWSSTFCPINAKTLLDADLNQLLVEDKHHKCPLQYVRGEDWDLWIDFLREHMDSYWPVGDAASRPLPPLPKDNPRPPQPNVLSIPLASQVAAGNISPDVVSRMDAKTKLAYNPNESEPSLYNLLCR